jgi:hypothetical protein
MVAPARVHIPPVAMAMVVMMVAEPAATSARHNDVILDPGFATVIDAAVVPSPSTYSDAAG